MDRDYYIFNNGTLKRKDNTLYFIDNEENKNPLPIEQINCLHLFGEVNINSKLLNYLPQFGILIKLYNYYGYYSGTYYPREKNISGFTVICQSAHYLDNTKRMYLAKCFIDSGVHHILRNLRRHKEKKGIEVIIEKIENERENISKVKKISELMGVEGRIRSSYYQSFNILLRNEFSFKKREKRPPTTPINALISFGNSLMYTAILSEMYKTHIDSTVSFLHEPSTKRFSLSLDIAEIFKPLIIDSLIFSLINNKMITKSHFQYEDKLCYLNEAGRKKFITEFEKKMKTTIKHRALKRKVSYRMLIRLECYKLIKHFINDETYKPLKAWW